MRLVFALVGDFSLDIMVEVSGGKLLSQKSQAPVPLSSFIQALRLVKGVTEELLFECIVSICGKSGSERKFVSRIEGWNWNGLRFFFRVKQK